MTIYLMAFESAPAAGTEAGLAWQWARAYRAAGYEVTVVTQAAVQDRAHATLWAQAGVEHVAVGDPMPVQAPETPAQLLKLSGRYHRWSRQAGALLRSRCDVELAQHLSLSSVRLRPSVLGLPDVVTVWGPIGGGHRAPVRLLALRSRPHEVLRNLSFGISRHRRAVEIRRQGAPTLTYVTNAETYDFARALGIEQPEYLLTDGVVRERVRQSGRNANTGPLRLLWLGRLVGSKRPDVALRVLHALHRRGVCAQLTLAGDGPERARLAALSDRLGLADRAHLVGRIPWDQTPQLYESSDVLLFHSLRDSSCPAVLEAAACGVPTVALRHQGVGALVPEVVARGPATAPSIATLVEALADQVEQLSDPSVYEHASAEAVRFAASNTWDCKVDRVLTRVRSVVR